MFILGACKYVGITSAFIWSERGWKHNFTWCFPRFLRTFGSQSGISAFKRLLCRLYMEPLGDSSPRRHAFRIRRISRTEQPDGLQSEVHTNPNTQTWKLWVLPICSEKRFARMWRVYMTHFCSGQAFIRINCGHVNMATDLICNKRTIPQQSVV